MAGAATDAQLAAFLVALRARGRRSTRSSASGTRCWRTRCRSTVDPMALDIVGTGGDRFGTVNVSTMASIVAAAAGVPVVKHGNRAASSASGSSDVLAALGSGPRRCPPSASPSVLDEAGITFAFAARLPPGLPPRGRGARRTRHPDRLQLPRPALQPGATRGIRRRSRPASTACRCSSACSRPAARPRWCSAATTGSTSSRRPGTATSGRCRAALVTEHDLDPRDLGIARVDDRPADRRRRGAQRRDRARVLRGRDRCRCATSCCSTPQPGSSRSSSRRTRARSSGRSWTASARRWRSPRRQSTAVPPRRKLEQWVAATKTERAT